MERKERIDAFGAVALVGFAALLAFNQVVIKVVNEGLQPVFFAGIRSLGAVPCVWLWMHFRGIRAEIAPGTVPAGDRGAVRGSCSCSLRSTSPRSRGWP